MPIVTVGIDLAKNVFAVHGVDEAAKAVLIKPRVSRDQLVALIAQLPPCCVFHTKLDKDFAASWTGFSHEAGHGFHGKLDSDFAPSWTVSS